MDTGTQVPANGNGTPQGTSQRPPGENGSVYDPAELDRKVQENARNLQRLMDQRFSRIDPAISQLQQSQQQITQQLAQINGYFTRANEADMDPAQRAQAENQRQLASIQQERLQSNLVQRALAAREQVAKAIIPLGFKWGDNEMDERLNWYQDLYNTNPEGWATAVITNAYGVKYQEDQRALESQRIERAHNERTRTSEQEQLTATQITNLQRQNGALTTDTAAPNGVEPNVFEKLQRLPPPRRRQVMEEITKAMRDGKISKPSEYQVPSQ